jgi:hypothetical protein
MDYRLPKDLEKQDHAYVFAEEICKPEGVNPVNHGEFEDAAQKIIAAAATEDGGRVQRCPIYVVQRCRRGGKTFMLHAVAKNEEHFIRLDGGPIQKTHIILISMNSITK